MQDEEPLRFGPPSWFRWYGGIALLVAGGSLAASIYQDIGLNAISTLAYLSSALMGMVLWYCSFYVIEVSNAGMKAMLPFRDDVNIGWNEIGSIEDKLWYGGKRVRNRGGTREISIWKLLPARDIIESTIRVHREDLFEKTKHGKYRSERTTFLVVGLLQTLMVVAVISYSKSGALFLPAVLALVSSVAYLFIPISLTVGAEGLRVRYLFREKLISWRSVSRIESDADFLDGVVVSVIILQLDSGKRYKVEGIKGGVAEIFEDMTRAHSAYHKTHSAGAIGS